MEIYLVLIAIIPGLIIYSELRNLECEKQTNEPEYIVLIRGILYSMPFFALLILYAGFINPGIEIQDSFKIMMWNYKNIILYFIAILAYSYLVVFLSKEWRLKIRPAVIKQIRIIKKQKAYECGYSSIWHEIREVYMKKYDVVVCRLIKDDKTIALGQISFISPYSESHGMNIGFLYQKQYSDYFPEGKQPLLENFCNYVDLETGYKIELYNGDNQISSD